MAFDRLQNFLVRKFGNFWAALILGISLISVINGIFLLIVLGLRDVILPNALTISTFVVAETMSAAIIGVCAYLLGKRGRSKQEVAEQLSIALAKNNPELAKEIAKAMEEARKRDTSKTDSKPS